MDTEKFLNAEHLNFQVKEDEPNFYILPDDKAVDQLLSKLKEKGLSDTIQVSLSAQSQVKQTNQEYDTLLDDMAARLQVITDTPPDVPPASTPTIPADTTLNNTMSDVERLLSDYLAVDGEQKVYLLPNDLNADQFLGSFAGLRTGEIKQSQMWRKTDVSFNNKEQNNIMTEINARFQAIDQRLQHLELLLNQTTGRDL